MKRSVVTILGCFISFLFAGTVSAQTYDQTTPYQAITSNNQAFTFTFTGLPTSGSAFANARVYVYYAGDFGDNSEWIDVVDPFSNNIGQAGPYPGGIDCSANDTAELYFPAVQLTTLGGTANLTLTTTVQVDPGCMSNEHIAVRLVFDYCSTGTISDVANIANTDSVICPGDGALALSGTPSGGTWSGAGVIGSWFNATNLAAGSYTVHYATSSNGCTSYDDITFFVSPHPVATSLGMVCGPHIDTLVSPSNSPYLFWYSDNSLITQVGAGDTFVTPMVNADTTFYAAYYAPNILDSFTTFSANNSNNIAIEPYTGDDRGGIAVTNNYVYVTGDSWTARYDHNLTNPVNYMGMSGIFSDLATGQLFTFYNTGLSQAMPPFGQGGTWTVDAIRTLNDDLTFGGQIIPLEIPITLDGGSFNALVLAGFGKVGLVNFDGHAYVIDLIWGGVEDLGASFPVNTSVYSSESWAAWGVLEYDGANYYALYRSSLSTPDISRRQLPYGAETIAFPFTDLSDMTNFTYSAANNRWYFHFEGASQFGGSDESLGYADATADTSSTYSFSCATPVRLRGFPLVDLGNDTTVCNGGQGINLDAGAGFDTYTWNGNTGTSTHQADTTDDYIVIVTDSTGCVATDTIHVTIDCTSVAGTANNKDITVHPNPNSGAFMVDARGWSGEINITISDLTGRLISNEKLHSNGSIHHKVSMDQLPAGIYVLQLRSGEKHATYKVSIEK